MLSPKLVSWGMRLAVCFVSWPIFFPKGCVYARTACEQTNLAAEKWGIFLRAIKPPNKKRIVPRVGEIYSKFNQGHVNKVI